MAYTKNTWQTGDIVSSAKLNHMEDGIAATYEVMVIDVTNNALDKTWKEIYDAMAQVKMCVVRENLVGGIAVNIVSAVFADSGYKVVAGTKQYSASSATGYPALDIHGGSPVV